jgi:hypothetical protein
MGSKKFRASLFVVVLLVVAQTWIAGAQEATPRIWLSAESEQVTAGQEFNVTVNVEGALDVYGGSFQVLYDPQAFEVVLTETKAVTPGAFFGDAPSFPLKNSADAAAGTIDYALTLTQPAEPVSGAGILGTMTFRALKDAPVNMMPVKASLVSPEFTEVDGRLVAQKINQVEAQISALTLADGSTTAQVIAPQPTAVVETQPEVVPAPITDTSIASASVGAIAPQTNDTPVMLGRQMNNRVLIVAGLFFFAGLVLLIISVGMYSKMRVRFSFAGDNLPEHSL